MKKIILISMLALLTGCGAERQGGGDVEDMDTQGIQIMDTQVFPESITSLADGTVIAGSVKGIVYRAEPGTGQALEWIHHSPENGILTILGVLADERSNTLWLCSAPNFFGPERAEGVTSLMAFDLTSAEQKGVYYFPGGGTCNDITVGADGSVFATDTPGGRILVLEPGAEELRVFGRSPVLVGIDGIAFSGDWTLYANNVQTQQIFRIGFSSNGGMGEITTLNLSHPLGGPDGMRLIEGNRFIQAEGTIGRLSVVTIEDNDAILTILDDTLISTPAATTVGNIAYVAESNIGYLFDPNLRGQEPPAFMLYAYRIE